ncbi:MAG: hypothetical protein M3Y12_13480 [Bacteroidota bacterium]|nr:hypothetical protein [Bacteroidota bacterium]
MNSTSSSQDQFPFGSASKAAKRKALWIGALWLLGGTALMFCISPFLLKSRFAAFNQAHLNALVESLSMADHGLAIQIRVKGNSYIFYPITSTGQADASRFIEKTHVGNFIRKESASDTIYLITSTSSSKILFRHF